MTVFPYIFTGAIMLVSLIVQGHSSFDVLRVGGVKPDLIFIAVVYFAYTFGSFYGEVTGFIGGLFHDAVSNAPLGLLTLPKVIIAYVVGLFGRSVFKQTWMTVCLLIFGASLLKGLLSLLLCFAFHDAFAKDIIGIVIPESIYNAILAPFLFILFDYLFANEIERNGY
jgi:rod shape-determining protein MreD